MKIDLDFPISRELQNLLDILKHHNGQPRFVGGMVRDALAGLKVSDIDIATKLKPNEIMDIMSKENIKYVDTGSEFGTITAIINNKPVEITTLRLDTECDGRHTKVVFTDSFEADAKRRDFTINSMSYCPFDGELYDYCGGYRDLKDKVVRFIGNPNERIIEDHLRIIRFFRFSDRFAKYLDAISLKACVDNKFLLGSLSKERIKMELDKMILSKTAHKILGLMVDNHIMEELIPFDDLDLDLMSRMNPILNLRYAAMLRKVPDLKILLSKLRFANAAIKEIAALASFRNFYGSLANAKNLKMIFYPLWVDRVDISNYVEISEVKANPNFEEIRIRMESMPPKFPINGNDIMELGIKGADIGSCLESLKMKWIISDFTLGREELLQNIDG